MVGVTDFVVSGGVSRADALFESLQALVWYGHARDISLVVLTRSSLDDLVNILKGRVLRLPLSVLHTVRTLQDTKGGTLYLREGQYYRLKSGGNGGGGCSSDDIIDYGYRRPYNATRP